MAARIIIVESDLFVCEDLSQILRETLERVTVIAVPDVQQALTEMQSGLRVDMVFLNGSAAQSEDAALLDLVDNHGAHLVRIGAPADRSGRTARHETDIAAPFTNDAIQEIFRNPRPDAE